MQNVVIAGACRTPIGRFLGALQHTHVRDLGRIAGQEAIRRAGIIPDDIDEIVCGNVIQAGAGANVARQIQGGIGIPWKAPAGTINQLCTSAMRAFEIGAHNIMLGKTTTCLVVGVENMSLAPYLTTRTRAGCRMGSVMLQDAMLTDALTCAIEQEHMGVTAENIAEQYDISRSEQDQLAMRSHQRACKAIRTGKFKDEIVSVEVHQNKATVVFETDEHPRENTTMQGLSMLTPLFRQAGSVTAGNASGVNDGAAAVVLMSADKARERGITALAHVIGTVGIGVAPRIMGLGPALAIPAVLNRRHIDFKDIDRFEINEAFASQFLGVVRMLKETCGHVLDLEKTNKNGSGISLGHPVGCSGLRIIVSLLYELRRRGGGLGCASLCAGGGPGMATLIKCT